MGSVDYDIILPVAVATELQASAMSVVSSVDNACVVDNVAQTADSSGQEEEQDAGIQNVDYLPEDNVEGDSSGLISLQRAYPSLAPCWRAAEAGRSDFVIYRDIIYHKDLVKGQPVSHLCIPEGGGLVCLTMIQFWVVIGRPVK